MKYLLKAIKVFDIKEIYKFCIIFVVSIISAILEMIGITLILPVLTILLNGDLNNTYFTGLDFIFKIINKINGESLLLSSLIFLASIFLLKNTFLFFSSFYNFKTVNMIGARISSSMFNKYLDQSYSFHINNNSTKLINNCISVVDAFKDTLISILILFTEFFILIGILSILLFFEPKGFLLCLIFISVFGFIIYLSSYKFLIKWGKDVLKANEKRFLFLSQAFNAIREIKVFNNKKFFVSKYHQPNYDKFRISTLLSTVNSIPRFLLEFIFIISLSLLLFFLQYMGYENNKIIMIMGLFSIATIRIMPCLNKIFTSFQILKFGQQSIEQVHKELSKEEQNYKDIKINTINTNEDKSLISFKDISFKYDKSNKAALNNINFEIKHKEFLAIIGQTGSGKTTLINLILGLLKPSTGNIFKNFFKPGFVSQSPYLIDDTIKNNIALGIDDEKIDIDYLYKCLKTVQLEKFINSQQNGIDTIIGEKGARISGGELQRLALARALYRKPDVIILDEPTSSLDENTEKKILNILSELSKKLTVIIVTHNFDNVQYCDRVMELENCQIKLSKTNNRT